jgi:hypothetical protein
MRLSRIYPFLLMILAFSCLAAGGAGDARAEVSININLGPPPIVVAEPPENVMVPGSRVYFVPDPQIDVFFYGGFWWSPRGSRWYRARAYDGPWVHMAPSAVPRAVIYMPRDYRVRYRHERPVPYGQWKKDHSRWEKEHWKEHKHWEKEREREWKQHKKQDRYERYGDHREYRDDDRRGPHGGHGSR